MSAVENKPIAKLAVQDGSLLIGDYQSNFCGDVLKFHSFNKAMI